MEFIQKKNVRYPTNIHFKTFFFPQNIFIIKTLIFLNFAWADLTVESATVFYNTQSLPYPPQKKKHYLE